MPIVSCSVTPLDPPGRLFQKLLDGGGRAVSLLLFDEVESESGKFDLKLQSTRQRNADSSLYFCRKTLGLLAIPVLPNPQIT